MCRSNQVPRRRVKLDNSPTTSSITTTNNNNKRRAHAWLARSTAQRTVVSVEAQVEHILTKCNFLVSDHHHDGSTIAPIFRHEIEVGQVLGMGAFSDVLEVKSIKLDGHFMDDGKMNDSRNRLAEKVCGKNEEEGTTTGYVIKHLGEALLAERSKFNNAATDLILEAKFLARMDHINIIKLHGWAAQGISSLGDGRHDGYFIILERLDETLKDRIEQWKISSKRRTTSSSSWDDELNSSSRLKYAIQIASALEYMHTRRIIYRDLKPANIGLKDDTIKLFDMGLCRELPETQGKDEDEVFEMSGAGTFRYIAPEIVLRQGYNLKADIYSFSIVLYEMLSLKKPFELYSNKMYHELVCKGNDRPPLPDYVSQEAQTLIRKMWHKEPSGRPNIQRVRQDLEDMGCVTASKKEKNPKRDKGFFAFPRFVKKITGTFCDSPTAKTVASTWSL